MEETGHPTQVLLKREPCHHSRADMEGGLHDEVWIEFSCHRQNFLQPAISGNQDMEDLYAVCSTSVITC